MKTIAPRHAFGVCVLMSFALTANAQYSGPSARTEATTAAAAQKAMDDAPVTLVGTIARQITSDTYEFRDSTGSITAEIDPEYFPAQPVDAKTKVRLSGEVDRDWNRVEVDVKSLQVL